MEQTQVVTVRGLRKSYAGRTVVDGIDLDVGAGEIVGLVGANGAGKTTTVECVQGLRKPDGGTLRVLSFDPVTQVAQVRARLGSQLQSSALPDRLRVGEAVRLFSGRAGDELLEQFGLAERRRAAFASLSGGERQRLFVVLALVNHPSLVVLDELTQGLDPTARRNVWAAIDQLRATGTAVLLVTHELDEAERLCDKVVAMRAGRVIDAGLPRDLIDRHGGAAVISFTLPPAVVPDYWLSRLGDLPGAGEVSVHRGRATVRGDRCAIAHVGALLVETDWTPLDLSVHMPSLEDALVNLLEADALEPPSDRALPELMGALR